MEGITMTYTNRRDFLKTVTATAVLTAIPPVQAKETPTMSKENFADVNGQHIFYSVHGAGKPLILLHGGINPDSFGSNLAELAKGRQVIAVHLQAHGRTPDTDRPPLCETSADVAKLQARTLLVFADADYLRPEHMVEFWKALGGGQRDAGIDGSLRPANQFAIVPNTTHYTLAVEPMLPEIVERFLGTA